MQSLIFSGPISVTVTSCQRMRITLKHDGLQIWTSLFYHLLFSVGCCRGGVGHRPISDTLMGETQVSDHDHLTKDDDLSESLTWFNSQVHLPVKGCNPADQVQTGRLSGIGSPRQDVEPELEQDL
uniref:Uncharacterized protein n=1 Tax=Cyprinodon variegatus TaxID=28743 RepID=A0A3Q2DN15_CYPVA